MVICARGYKQRVENGEGKLYFKARTCADDLEFSVSEDAECMFVDAVSLKTMVNEGVLKCIKNDMADIKAQDWVLGSVTYNSYSLKDGVVDEYGIGPSKSKYGRHGKDIMKHIINLEYMALSKRPVQLWTFR